jgi:hypothetical protein
VTPLGKALVFCVKYPAEMNRLYWQPKKTGKEPDLGDLADKEHVVETAAAVGEAACGQAAGFLTICAERIGNHFASLGIVKIRKPSKRATMKRKWVFEASLRITTGSGGWFWYGVSILRDDRRLILPWLWRKGGRAWEEKVMRRLGTRAHSCAGRGLKADRGTVALAAIPLLPEDPSSLDVDRELLVDRVVQAFVAIQPEEIEAISRGTGVGDGPDELPYEQRASF